MVQGIFQVVWLTYGNVWNTNELIFLRNAGVVNLTDQRYSKWQFLIMNPIPIVLFLVF